MLTDLKELIEFASTQVDKIFKRTQVISPMYHAIKSNGHTLVIPAMHPDKDIGVALIKAAFVLEDVDRYVYVDEAWVLNDRDGKLGAQDWAKIRREGLRNHPDRREVVLFSAENRKGEMRTASRYILRPEIGKPTLTPLKIDDMSNVESSGRMVGLLQKG